MEKETSGMKLKDLGMTRQRPVSADNMTLPDSISSSGKNHLTAITISQMNGKVKF